VNGPPEALPALDAPLSGGLAALARHWAEPDLIPEAFGIGAAHARDMHEWPLEYYAARVQQLGLRGARVLDAGCGAGTWSFALRTCFEEVAGFDVLPEMAGLAARLAARFEIPDLHFTVADLTRLPYAEARFDAVFCYGVVISVVPAAPVLRELFRVLRPGGVLYLCVNGIGWSMYLRDERGRGDEAVRAMGTDGIYNTLCRWHLGDVARLARGFAEPGLAPLRAPLFDAVPAPAKSPRRRAVEAVVDTLRGTREERRRLDAPRPAWCPDPKADPDACLARWCELERALGGGDTLAATAARIRRECGDDYAALLARDLHDMAHGRAEWFSHANAGRGYRVEDVRALAARAGFVDWHWAGEGRLRATTGAVVAPVHPGTFAGELEVWECMAFRPAIGLGGDLDAAFFRARAAAAASATRYAPAHVPLVTNADPGACGADRVRDARRLARAAGGAALVAALAAEVAGDAASEEMAARRLLRFAQDVLVRDPAVQPLAADGEALLDAEALLFLNVGRCGAAASLLAALLEAAGIAASRWQLPAHVVVAAQVDGREVVLDADGFKGGVALEDEAGRLLAREALVADPQRADRLPHMAGWYAACGRRLRDLWGRQAAGYVEDRCPLYSTLLAGAPARRWLPAPPRVRARMDGDAIRVAWQARESGASDLAGTVGYEVTVGSASRGWDYARAATDGTRYHARPGGLVRSARTDATSARLDRPGAGTLFVEVRPCLVEHPDAFCWPSAQVRIEDPDSPEARGPA